MHEILSRLEPGDWVLDLGAAGGSFPVSATSAHVVRVDLEPRCDRAVAADAARLPFADGTFRAIIANHSLEHMERLDETLREMGHVLAAGGCLFVSVPDASTLTDRIYRWLARGGGHVNPFTDSAALADRISAATGAACTAVRTLHTGLSFLNRRNFRTTPPRRIAMIGGGSESFLRWFTLGLRWCDRSSGTRLSVYGWALYFGPVEGALTVPLPNVCVRCGSAHDPADLKRSFPAPRWRCADCGAENFFTTVTAFP